MNSIEIAKILKSDSMVSKCFLGVYASDQLPRRRVTAPCALVANTDPITKSGQHWVAFHVSNDRQGTYFDSYGKPPAVNIFEEFLDKNCHEWTFNKKRIQGNFSSTCGQYSIYFLTHKCRGYSLPEIVSAFDGYDDNDEAVVEFVNSRYDVNTDVLDVEFIVKQICKALY